MVGIVLATVQAVGTARCRERSRSVSTLGLPYPVPLTVLAANNNKFTENLRNPEFDPFGNGLGPTKVQYSRSLITRKAVLLQVRFQRVRNTTQR
jgi:hypothetical protein